MILERCIGNDCVIDIWIIFSMVGDNFFVVFIENVCKCFMNLVCKVGIFFGIFISFI